MKGCGIQEIWRYDSDTMQSICRDNMDDRNQPVICPQCGKEALPPKKINSCGSVVDTIRSRPDLTLAQIAESFAVSLSTVLRYAKRAGITRKRGIKPRKD